MIVKMTLKPIKNAGDFFLVALFLFPLFFIANIMVVAIPLWLAWNGVHMYWDAVKPIGFELAIRFAFGINLLMAIIGAFRKSD